MLLIKACVSELNVSIFFLSKICVGSNVSHISGLSILSIFLNLYNHQLLNNNEIDLIEFIVSQIINGKVIGFFHGAFEWGPRALGNRSIIVDPRIDDMKNLLNKIGIQPDDSDLNIHKTVIMGWGTDSLFLIEVLKYLRRLRSSNLSIVGV